MTISSDELASMRDVVEALCLPLSCTIIRNTTTINDYGQSSDTPSTIASGVSCAIAVVNRMAEAIAANREISEEYHWLTVPWDTDLQQEDIVTIDADSFRVVSLYDDHAFRVSIRAMVVRVR